MGFKRTLRLLTAILFIAVLLLAGISGPYEEGPWITPPLFGSPKVELGGRRVSANSTSITAVISKRDIPSLVYFTKLEKADFRFRTFDTGEQPV